MDEAIQNNPVFPSIVKSDESHCDASQDSVDLSYSAITTSIYDRIRVKNLDFIIIAVSNDITAEKIKKRIADILNMSECTLLTSDNGKNKKNKNRPFSDCGIMREYHREYFSLKISDYPRLIITRDLKYAIGLIEASNVMNGCATCFYYQFHDKNGLVDTDVQILGPLQRCKNVIQFKIKSGEKRGRNTDLSPNNMTDVSMLLRSKFKKTYSTLDACAICCKYTFAAIVFIMFLMTMINIVVRKMYSIPM